MSEIKCPVCGSDMVLYEEHMDGSDTIACMECPFSCAEKDQSKIAAAIELARKLKELSQCDINPHHYHIEKQVEAAERRVLEVFK